MPEQVDLYHNAEGYHLAEGIVAELADHRVNKTLFLRYTKALAALRAVETEIERTAQKPIVVTPDQEDAFRRAAKPDAWIVVREPVVEQPESRPAERPARDSELPAAAPDPGLVLVDPLTVDDVLAAEHGAPKRPRPGSCPQRGGLPHTSMRYVITDGMSVYDPGRKRVDGLCSCGERIPDVKCPHQKQQPGVVPPMCAWCNKVLIAGGGNIDNRLPDGRPDPRIKTEVPPGFAAGDDNKAIRAAFRAED